MINHNLEIIRAYYLSFDGENQYDIFLSLSDDQKDLILEAGVFFLSGAEVETLSEDSLLSDYKNVLKDIQLEYFIGLAEIVSAGGSNEVIEKLLRSHNLLFQEVLAEFKENALFENDLLTGIRSVERKELKQDQKLFDKDEDELGIPDEEINYAITQIERMAFKKRLQEFETSLAENDIQHTAAFSEDIEPNIYSRATFSISRIRLWPYAVAAALVTIVVGTGLNYYYQASTQTDTIVKHTKQELPRLPNLIQTQEVTQSVWQDESIVGFSKKTDSIKIKITGLSTQIDTLQKILEKGSKESNSEYRQLDNIIISQIDSLQALVNTYTYFRAGKTLYLNLARKVNPIRAYVLDDKNGSNLYIRLQEQYFLIIGNTKPYKLSPVTNQLVIQELKKVEFLNE